MEVSLVIPTFNRERDLREALCSILRQTKLPKEVILVDDSDNYKTRDLIERMSKDFLSKKITTKYLRREGNRGIAASRNIGVTLSTGSIIFFVDDDVILDKEYIEEVLKVYEKHPNAMGVQGYVKNFGFSALGNSIRKVFFLFHQEENRCRVLPSGAVTYPYSPCRMIKCQWMSGSNSSYRKVVFKNFKFDEKLKEYSLGEDLDFSYRINKHYPDSLYMTPHAKVIHKASLTPRSNSKRETYISVAYPTYLFYKNVEQTIFNKIILAWSMLGRFLADTLGLMLKRKKSRLIVFLIGAYAYTLKHLSHIKDGNFTFLSYH